ncbi:adhesin [Stenotrophomonas sp. S41]|uniref:adhesin n=1 Tax=Stenotrophomonas sp. S41 TaxID=2767464 RepID=UPI00190DA750|nr:adhesin [Stenotrophomonas sp. S41]MBK0011471.1 adhesin [Stenotrophomonas sp. S41]
MIRLAVLLLSASLCACASQPTVAVQCPEATITYVGNATESGVTLGRFQIIQRGGRPLRLPLFSVDREVHGNAATIWIRDAAEQDWRRFNINLEEYAPSTAHLVVAPGEVETFLYHGEGAFLPGAVHEGQALSIVVRDQQGCMHRSLPFVPGAHRPDVDPRARGQ